MHFLWKILQEILVGNLAGNFKICKSSSGSAAGNAVGNVVGKYSFLKPILNRFSHLPLTWTQASASGNSMDFPLELGL